MAALLPTPQPEAEDGVRASAARGTEGKSAGCGGQPELEAPDPGIGLLRLGGAASRHFIRRGGQLRVGRASMRSFRCCT